MYNLYAFSETRSKMDKWLSDYMMSLKENLTDDVQQPLKKSRKLGAPTSNLKTTQEKAEAMSASNWLNRRYDNRY